MFLELRSLPLYQRMTALSAVTVEDKTLAVTIYSTNSLYALKKIVLFSCL